MDAAAGRTLHYRAVGKRRELRRQNRGRRKRRPRHGLRVLFLKESPMRITYDREVDALYIRFQETTVTTKHLAEGIAADYDAEGRLAGIEILDTMKRLGDPTVFKRVTLEDVAIAH